MRLDLTEAEYARAEREGMRLDSLLCPECPDPVTCAAEGVCVHAEAAERDLGLWDDPETLELAA